MNGKKKSQIDVLSDLRKQLGKSINRLIEHGKTCGFERELIIRYIHEELKKSGVLAEIIELEGE